MAYATGGWSGASSRIKVVQRGVTNPTVEPRDEAIHSFFWLPLCCTLVQAEVATPLHVREAREALVRCLDARALVGKRRWDDDPKQLPRAHGETIFDALQTVEADAYVKLQVAARSRRFLDHLNGAGRCLRDFS